MLKGKLTLGWLMFSQLTLEWLVLFARRTARWQASETEKGGQGDSTASLKTASGGASDCFAQNCFSQNHFSQTGAGREFSQGQLQNALQKCGRMQAADRHTGWLAMGLQKS